MNELSWASHLTLSLSPGGGEGTLPQRRSTNPLSATGGEGGARDSGRVRWPAATGEAEA
jgi:hypothetical protein